MFNSISWQSYWLTLALLLAGYYLTIILLYYRSDFSVLLHRKSDTRTPTDLTPFPTESGVPTLESQPSLFENDAPAEFERPQAGTEEHVVYSCMDELTAFFGAAKRRKWVKEELMQALQGILRKYPALKTSSYKASLSNVIITECEHNCSLHLSVEDVDHVWLGA